MHPTKQRGQLIIVYIRGDDYGVQISHDERAMLSKLALGHPVAPRELDR